VIIPQFEAADLARKVEALASDELDELPYGVVKLDPKGVVQIYSRAEATLSGRKKRPTVGLDFWSEVAPCMAGPELRGHVEAAAALGAVDIEIGWIGDFDDPHGEIKIRVLSASDGGLWLFMNRDAD
jgi:photoactive yellow protein